MIGGCRTVTEQTPVLSLIPRATSALIPTHGFEAGTGYQLLEQLSDKVPRSCYSNTYVGRRKEGGLSLLLLPARLTARKEQVVVGRPLLSCSTFCRQLNRQTPSFPLSLSLVPSVLVPSSGRTARVSSQPANRVVFCPSSSLSFSHYIPIGSFPLPFSNLTTSRRPAPRCGSVQLPARLTQPWPLVHFLVRESQSIVSLPTTCPAAVRACMHPLLFTRTGRARVNLALGSTRLAAFFLPVPYPSSTLALT